LFLIYIYNSLKSASTLNSTTDDDLLFDYLLNKDNDSEIKIIPRHPQHANKDNSSLISSSIPQQKVRLYLNDTLIISLILF